MSELLLKRFLDAVPRDFVKWLLERQLSIYQQSVHFAFDEQSWDTPEAISVLPIACDAQCGKPIFGRAHVRAD